MKKRLISLPTAWAAIWLLSACNGLFDGLYDEPDDEIIAGFGFQTSCGSETAGVIYIDATSYTDWVYINFSDQKVYTINVENEAPQSWDIAVHRYDVKTNGGKAIETAYSTIADAIKADYADDLLTADQWTTQQIVTDMSTMMDDYLSYVESYYNPELSKWLNVDTSTMPPVYTLSDKVYIIELADKVKAAVKLVNYMDETGVKGFLTIEYICPF